MLDIILIVISALCMIAGLAGCILPFLPGPPIASVYLAGGSVKLCFEFNFFFLTS